MGKITDNALVLREVKTGESDRILTLLSMEHGILSVMAKGSMKPKSKLFSASGLFSYSEWTLREGKNLYWVDEATPIEVFFGLRENIEAISLATYIAELLQIYSPVGDEAGALLRLALNSYFLLSRGQREASFVKAVFELRSLAEAGFMPDLGACQYCGREESPGWYFEMRRGLLLCAACAAKKESAPNLDAAALEALRYIAQGEPQKIFGFNIPSESFVRLAAVAEEFLLFSLEYPPKSLRFLKSVLSPVSGK